MQNSSFRITHGLNTVSLPWGGFPSDRKAALSSSCPQALEQSDCKLFVYESHLEKKFRQSKSLTFLEWFGSRPRAATQFTIDTKLCDINRRQHTVLRCHYCPYVSLVTFFCSSVREWIPPYSLFLLKPGHDEAIQYYYSCICANSCGLWMFEVL